MRTDYLSRPVTDMIIPDKNVLCYRCLRVYNLSTAPRMASTKLRVQEPCCPNCKCKVYFS